MTELLPSEVLPVPTKPCIRCGLEKVVPDDFSKDPRTKDGRTGVCKVCSVLRAAEWAAAHPERVRDFRHAQYNIDFNAMWESQAGLCAVCGEAMLPRGKATRSVVVDHDHKCCPPRPGRAGASCGKCVRGLVHRQCNMWVGQVEKNSNLIKQAETYVRSWRERLT